MYVRVLTQAQASGRRINVFLGRARVMQCLSFDDVPGSAGRLHTTALSSLALGMESAESDTVLVRCATHTACRFVHQCDCRVAAGG